MNNLEHTIQHLSSQFKTIEIISKLLIKLLIPIINIKVLERESIEYRDIEYGKDNYLENTIFIADEIKKKKNAKNTRYVFFYKNIRILYEKYSRYKKFQDYYNLNIIKYLTKYFFYKNKQINNNKNNIINGDFNNEIVSSYNQYKNFISTNDVYGKINSFYNYVVEFVNVYTKDQFLSSDYELSILLEPHMLKNKTTKNVLFLNEIVSEFNTVDSVVKHIKNIIATNGNTSYSVNMIEKNEYEICKLCNHKMNVKINTSELTCYSCGNIITLIGTVFEDSHFYGQEGGRYKHGSYSPMRHCKSWVDSLQAKEGKIIEKNVLEQIRNRITKNKIVNIKNISIEQYRKYLKDLKLTKYNNHIILIRKCISGVSPPQLTHLEINKLYMYFDKSIKTYLEIKPPSKRNSMFYPFYIYKIIELIIEDPLKKKEILNCIHLQEKSTLIDNDKYWMKICEIHSFKFIPTDKSKYQ